MGAMAGAGGPLVDDAEDICRLCFKAGVPITVDGQYPDDIDPKTKRLRVTQLSQQDLVRRGFSVQVVSRYSLQQALAEPNRKERQRRRLGKPFAGFRLAGVLKANVGAIHRLSDDSGTQAFYVLQDPTPESDAHAKILLSPELKGGPYLKWRKELVTALGAVQPYSILDSRSNGFVAFVRRVRIHLCNLPGFVWERFVRLSSYLSR